MLHLLTLPSEVRLKILEYAVDDSEIVACENTGYIHLASIIDCPFTSPLSPCCNCLSILKFKVYSRATRDMSSFLALSVEIRLQILTYAVARLSSTYGNLSITS